MIGFAFQSTLRKYQTYFLTEQPCGDIIFFFNAHLAYGKKIYSILWKDFDAYIIFYRRQIFH